MIQPLLTNFAASDSGIGALGVDAKAFLIQLITFILVFVILKRYAFKPIIKVLHDRRELIESGVSIGEQMKKDQAELEAKVAAELKAARAEADAVMASAQDSAKDVIREAEAKAHIKGDAIIAESKDRTKQDIARARKQLEGELVGLISDATEAIIDEKVDAKKDASLIDKALKGRATV